MHPNVYRCTVFPLYRIYLKHESPIEHRTVQILQRHLAVLQIKQNEGLLNFISFQSIIQFLMNNKINLQ